MSRFHPGQIVRINDRAEQRHHRVPEYAKGRIGVVDELCSYAPLPEEVATWVTRPEIVPVYRILLTFTSLLDGYQFPKDRLEIEVYENWLSAT